jgi:hypothetical protein
LALERLGHGEDEHSLVLRIRAANRPAVRFGLFAIHVNAVAPVKLDAELAR